MQSFIKTSLGVYEISEVDFDLYYELFGKEWEGYDEDMNDLIISRKSSKLDAEEINIERLITILKNYQEQGANYIKIEHHIDHQGYLFEPIKIEEDGE